MKNFLFEARVLLNFFKDTGVHFFIQTWNTDHERGMDFAHILGNRVYTDSVPDCSTNHNHGIVSGHSFESDSLMGAK